jgi:hypothetical protein
MLKGAVITKKLPQSLVRLIRSNKNRGSRYMPHFMVYHALKRLKADCINLALNAVPIKMGEEGELLIHKRMAPVF